MLYSTGNITNFQGIFDTQIAHRMCYEDENNCISNGTKNNSISLSELLKINFGINVKIKDEIHELMSNSPYLWKERPIRYKLNYYAGCDVYYLPKLYDLFCQKIEAKIVKNISIQDIFNECQKYLKESGFLNNKVDANGKLFPQENHSDNMKIERGSVKLKDEHIQKVVEIEKHICKHVTGTEGKLYRHIDMIKEVCGNTVDWSGAVKDQWSYGVKFEEGKVIVVALDLGKGILESISRRFVDIVGDALTIKSHVDILEGAYNKKYGSTSKRRNRNRGLPMLKYCNERGIIRFKSHKL